MLDISPDLRLHHLSPHLNLQVKHPDEAFVGSALYRDYIAIGVIYDGDKVPVYNDVNLIVLTPDVTLAGDRGHKQST